MPHLTTPPPAPKDTRAAAIRQAAETLAPHIGKRGAMAAIVNDLYAAMLPHLIERRRAEMGAQ